MNEADNYKGTEWDCIDMECTHWDGDMCTLGFCEPDILAVDIEEYPHEYTQEELEQLWVQAGNNGGLSEE